jgi:hypothetical protein
VYDPCAYHDRLLLGLSGIMSEAELLRDRRDEKRASIRMRKCRRMRDERRA